MSVLFLSADLVFSSRLAAAGQRLGINVSTVSSIDAAVERIQGNLIELVVCDLSAPGAEPQALVAGLRREQANLAIVAYAPHVHEKRLEAATEAGWVRFAEGGAELGITPETLARITAPPEIARPRDEVLGIPSYFSLGFLRPGPEAAFGSSPRAFGAPGAGGSFAFADPDARLGYAYVMNRMDFYLTDDPREKALRDALYRAMG